MPPVIFGLKAPCRVPAVYFDSDNDNGSAMGRLALEFTPSAGGLEGVFELRFADVQVEMLSDVRIGEDADPEARMVLHAATLGALPTRLIGPGGHDLGPGDREAAIERAVAPLGADAAASLAESLGSPEFSQGLDAAGERVWRSFFGEWIDFAPSGPRSHPVEWKGTPLVEVEERRNLGRVRDRSELVLLEVQRRLEGPPFTAAVLAAAVARAEAAGREAPSADAIAEARRTELISVALDPERGLPHHVLYQSVFVVNDKQQIHVEEWALDWNAAEGCGLP